MTFALGPVSDAHLEGVHPELVRAVRYAIAATTVDFQVFEGLRSLERQKELVAKRVSRTMKSYHLTGDAVDLVPWIAGRLQWQAPACLSIALAMYEAARILRIRLVWGAVWDRELNELDPAHLKAEVREYERRWRAEHPGGDSDPLIDYPHFQRVRA